MTIKKKKVAVRKKRPVRRKAATRYPNRLNARLEELGLSKNKVAISLDLERAYLSRLASGHNLPSVVAGIAIARKLDTSVEDIWGGLKLEDCRRR